MANLQENRFFNRAFYTTITDADIGSLNSLYLLFDKYLDHVLVKFEHHRIVQIVEIFIFLAKKKMVKHF